MVRKRRHPIGGAVAVGRLTLKRANHRSCQREGKRKGHALAMSKNPESSRSISRPQKGDCLTDTCTHAPTRKKGGRAHQRTFVGTLCHHVLVVAVEAPQKLDQGQLALRQDVVLVDGGGVLLENFNAVLLLYCLFHFIIMVISLRNSHHIWMINKKKK